MLRLAFATGTEPGKWFRRFRESTAHGGLETLDADDALATLLDGGADLALARVPARGDERIDGSFHVVRLYAEAPGVAVPKDSVYAEVGEDVRAEDVADEYLNYRIPDSGLVDVEAVRAGLQVVGANVGIVIAPRPLLKVLSKKQVVPLGLVDAEVPRTEICLVWRKYRDADDIQDFVGVAKGRTKNSSRQVSPKRSAREKAKAKQARRAAARSLPKSKKSPDRHKRRK
ncbi:LysR family transcriptional regulator substrate-binding protein [Corynebacterium confusum]|uniref:LysR family transcriptional regulator substrate-binding protein n=1 Tax=Corynebacterium confusum TaxID=71254 RepID=UPI0025B3B856|nr:LysR family transcriptional regulator substrate-binding protein [Corynebacterium confusum]WJY89413.1 LysR substrate binding domain protein [Corynebacterium confusum]